MYRHILPLQFLTILIKIIIKTKVNQNIYLSYPLIAIVKYVLENHYVNESKFKAESFNNKFRFISIRNVCYDK